MDAPDFDALFDSLDPEQYRDFRVLYNELIGYIERNEVDKIIEFSKRIEYHVALSLELKQSLEQTMQHQIKQRSNVKKQMLRATAATQPTTIAVTHPFPCAQAKQTASEESVSINHHDAEAPEPAFPDKTDELLERMRSHKHRVDTVVTDDAVVTHAVQHALNDSPDAARQSQTLAMPDPDAPVADTGYVSRDAEVQENLAIRSSSQSSKQKTRPKQDSVTNDQTKLDAYEKRRARIQSYIDQHQSKGGITHEL